ncbi:hypothetical protein [Undibacterium sp. GrIS 1.8]|uniref:hypothetical protein n=1 Tax=Undibacterium sp. GrIS 1.8 TaxID=3143934 RepID=UPI0033908C38
MARLITDPEKLIGLCAHALFFLEDFSSSGDSFFAVVTPNSLTIASVIVPKHSSVAGRTRQPNQHSTMTVDAILLLRLLVDQCVFFSGSDNFQF